MKDISTKNFYLIFIVFLLVNIGIFCYVNTTPIFWLLDEIPCYRFYWSMDDLDSLTLHSGFKKGDLLKPFVSRYTHGAFCARQVSNFFEMISYKFWQFLNIGYFRDHSLIMLHVINVMLLWFLVVRITRNKYLAWLAALMMLNAGVALPTLLFPTRPNKLLVMTFFLTNWNVIAYSLRPFYLETRRRLMLFSFILVLSFLTGESFVFVFPLYFIYLFIRDGRQGVLNKRLWTYVSVSLLSVVLLAATFYVFSQSIIEGLSWHGVYFSKLAGYLTDMHTFKDIYKSLTAYFLRRNFGYWGLSLSGGAAFMAFVSLLFLAYKSPKDNNVKILVICLMASILLKAFLLPQQGVYPYIMPPGTVFPSMLFFGYYYVYMDAFLAVLALMLLLNTVIISPKRFIIALSLVLVINISNMVHVKEGIRDTLRFHELDTPPRHLLVANVLKTKKVLSKSSLKPLYLSFPSGEESLVDGRFGFDKSWPVYTAYVLTMFLPYFESTQAVTSLENIRPVKTFDPGQELFLAKTFYDIVTHDIINLEQIRLEFGEDKMKPQEIPGGTCFNFDPVSIDKRKGNLVFFVRGDGIFSLSLGGDVIQGRQTYGQSYQMIRTYITKKEAEYNLQAKLTVCSKKAGDRVYVIGPFLLNKE